MNNGYKSMSYVQENTSSIEKQTAKSYLNSVIPSFTALPFNSSNYQIRIGLTPCPDSTIINVGLLLSLQSTQQTSNINFNYTPSNAEIVAYIGNDEIINKCDPNSESSNNIYTCLLVLSFSFLDLTEAYGTQAGSSILFWLTLQTSGNSTQGIASTELYISALNDQYNCNCTIMTNVPLSLSLCSTELCEEGDKLESVNLNDKFYVKAEITDPENRNIYNLSPNSVYLCMSGIYSTSISSNICVNFINQTKLISSLPGQVIMELGAYIVGDISIKVITLLEPVASRILASQKNGVVGNLSLKVSNSSSSDSNTITYIIIFSSIGGGVLMVSIFFIIFFCFRSQNIHTGNSIKLSKDTLINIEKNTNLQEEKIPVTPKVIKIVDSNPPFSLETNGESFAKTKNNNQNHKGNNVEYNI